VSETSPASLTSLHTHTLFCDGTDDVETMCRAAHAKGLAAIGFSAHAPMGKTGLITNWHIKDERLGEYIDEVRAARERWEGKLSVYLGLEIDYIKGRRSALDRDIQSLNLDCLRRTEGSETNTLPKQEPVRVLDYLIGSVHYLLPPHGEPFTVDGPLEEVTQGIAEGFSNSGEAMVSAYWDAVLEMLAVGGFDIVGHLDLVKKHNTEGGKAAHRLFSTGNRYMRRVAEVVRVIAAGGYVVEVNTGGMNRGSIAETYPSPEILRLLRQHNVPVMITADAHNANDLDGHYPAARQTLLDAGYTSHVIFAGRKDAKPQWREQAS
jgi:histidinol-phosphatase (PHP family)